MDTSKMTDEVNVFDLEGKQYQIRRIDVFAQLSLVAKLSIVLATVGEQKDKELILQNFAKFFAAFAASMTKEDLNEIFKLSLSSIYRRNKTTWQPIFKNGQMLFQDIDLKTMLTLVWRTVETNKLADFFTINDTNQIGSQDS